MTVTIKDVAKKAKVSAATVSLVLNKNRRISSETSDRVLKAVKALDYHRSRSARDLVSRQSGNIGFVLTDDHFSRSEPFYTKIFLGTEFQARDSEFYVLLTTISSNYRSDDPLPRFVLEKNVEGIVLAGKLPQSFIENLKRYNVPLMFVDYYPGEGNYPVVMSDNISGGFQATQHLIDCGHRRIAFVNGDRGHPSINERLMGYKLALEKSGMSLNSPLPLIYEASTDRVSGFSAAETILKKYPDVTAIFACNDAMAIGILQYLKQKGLRVPKDVSLIGFDDVEADLSLDPPLTTMRVNKEEMGVQAVKQLVEIIHNRSTIPRKTLVPVELVIRGSTCKVSK
jgi:LacI family transcriptional regulator